MTGHERCDIPAVPVALDAVTSCGVCSELYQAVFVEAPVPVLGSYEGAQVGTLVWVRLDEVPEDRRTIEKPEWGDPPVQSPNQLLPQTTEVLEDADEIELATRIEYMTIPHGRPTPVTIDMGSESGILIQPKPDQKDGEVALNVVAYGQWDPGVVAWLLNVASEQLTLQLRLAAMGIMPEGPVEK